MPGPPSKIRPLQGAVPPIPGGGVSSCNARVSGAREMKAPAESSARTARFLAAVSRAVREGVITTWLAVSYGSPPQTHLPPGRKGIHASTVSPFCDQPNGRTAPDSMDLERYDIAPGYTNRVILPGHADVRITWRRNPEVRERQGSGYYATPVRPGIFGVLNGKLTYGSANNRIACTGP